jgi:hypothetical protein
MTKIERQTEKIARELAQQETGSMDMWELFLTLAYNKFLFPDDKKRYNEEKRNVKSVISQIMKG